MRKYQRIMDINYSPTFTLYGKDGNPIPLRYTNVNELTFQLGEYLPKGTKFVPIISVSRLDENMRPIRVVESIRIM